MALTFFEHVLDEFYSPSPRGGPEFSHSVFTVPTSGVEEINRNHPTALHRYSIPYQHLKDERRQRLYSLFLVVGGMGGAFRMLAPERHNQAFEDEPMAGTGSIWRLQKTHSFTAESYYGGATSSYAQRIVKPIYGEVEIYVSGVLVDLTADGTMDWTTGTFTFDAPPGATPRATGRYHLPVRFATDWLEMAHDITSESGGMEVVEVLPKTIGINA
jgi:uncharacterized protein (TIGR02217 family)